MTLQTTRMQWITWLLPMVVVCLLLPAGCSQSTRPPLGAVHGTVTLDGKPLAGAGVTFRPVEPGRASMAVTDADGHYELSYIRKIKGAKVGVHHVSITPARRKAGRSGSGLRPQGTLQVEVKPGDNVFDFPLKSK